MDILPLTVTVDEKLVLGVLEILFDEVVVGVIDEELVILILALEDTLDETLSLNVVEILLDILDDIVLEIELVILLV
jgi:hypothetical protein